MLAKKLLDKMKLEKAMQKPEDDEVFKHKERLNVIFLIQRLVMPYNVQLSKELVDDLIDWKSNH